MGKRDYSLDFLKAASMILVIVIHLSNYYCRNAENLVNLNFISSIFYNGLSRVSVPLFFMISGIVILNGSYDRKKYLNRIIRFVIIVAFWNLIYYFWDAFYMKYEYNILSDIFTVFFEPIKVHLWFMYPLIGLYIVAPFIQKMVQLMDRKLENLFIFLWLLFSGGISLIVSIFQGVGIKINLEYPIPLVQSSYWLGYFVVGYFLYKRLQLIKGEKKYNLPLLAVFLISSLITLGLALIISIVLGEFINNLFMYRSLFIMISSISLFCLVILNSEKILKKPVLWFVKAVVPYSFGIYLSHLIFYNILVKEFDILKLNGFYAVPVFTVLIFMLSFSFTFVLSKVPFLRKVV